MSPTLLFLIRRLAGKDGLKLGLTHARSRQSTSALHGCSRAHYDYEIDRRFPASLEQQRHVHDDQSAASGLGAIQELTARLRHGRMHDPFKTPKGLSVAQHLRSKALAIDLSGDDNARKGGLDHSRALSSVEVSDGLIGVKCWDAKLGEHAGDGRFPHRDRACQSGNDQCADS
jgi:hypothetical protein